MFPTEVGDSVRRSVRAIDDLNDLKSKAEQVSEFVRLFANDKRLLILAKLQREREMSVNDLANSVDLSQSALSQHLATRCVQPSDARGGVISCACFDPS